MEETNPTNFQHVEIISGNPLALLVSGDDYLSDLLCRYLLNLSLEVRCLLLSPSLKLQSCCFENKLNCTQIQNPDELLSQITKPPDYIFQLYDQFFLEQQPELFQQVAESLNFYASNNQIKDLLVINYFSTSAIFSSSIPDQKFIKSLQSTLLIKLLDVFGPGMSLEKGIIADLLSGLQQRKTLIVNGEGLNSVFPFPGNQVPETLVKLIFSDLSLNLPLLLAGAQEITEINLAYKIRELEFEKTKQLPDLNFGPQPKETETERTINLSHLKTEISQTRNFLGLEKESLLDKDLQTTLSWIRKTENPTRSEIMEKSSPPQTQIQPEIEKTTTVINDRKKSKFLKFKSPFLLLSLPFLAILLYPLIFLLTTGVGTYSLKLASQNLLSGNLSAVQPSAVFSNQSFQLAKLQLFIISPAFSPFPPAARFLQRTDDYLSLGQLGAQTIIHSGKALEFGLQLKEGIVGTQAVDLLTLHESLVAQASSAYRKLNLAEALISQKQSLSSPPFFRFLDEKINSTISIFTAHKQAFAEGLEVLNLLPRLLSFSGKSTYLILLQNNSELRPTGGFIGSYALLSFSQGKLTDFTVEDVYTADGQLKGHVEPPIEIKKYLGEAGWYLRDANWDPDFPSSARKIEWFFAKETGQQVDAVIGLNLYLVQNILRNLDPLFLSDYRETITADNLFERAEYHSEVNFFPGSTQKKDFLGSLTGHLFNSLQQANPQTLLGILNSLHTSLQSRQLLIFHHDPRLAATFSQKNWDGSLIYPDCLAEASQRQCIFNYLGFIEANLGVNKANYFITRSYAFDFSLSEDTLRSTASLLLTNKSENEQWPGGTYKNYQRVYLTDQSRLESLKINGEELDSSKINLSLEHGRQVAGFLVKIPPQEQTQIQLITTQKIDRLEDYFTLTTFIPKQSGTGDDSLFLTFSFPAAYRLTGSSPSLSSSNTSTYLDTNLFRDLNLQIDLQKQ